MKDFKIVPMKFPDDKESIASWQTSYAGTQEFEDIKKYILEDDYYTNLGEVIEVNHEIFPIGDNEKKLAFVAKNSENEILAWILLDVFNLNTHPELFLQYIVINPKFQHQGYGTEIGKEIFLNSEKYIGVKPSEIFAYIDTTNYKSMQLFSKFNFKLKPMADKFFRAFADQPKLISQSSFGE